jgi:hypothetical protein
MLKLIKELLLIKEIRLSLKRQKMLKSLKYLTATWDKFSRQMRIQIAIKMDFHNPVTLKITNYLMQSSVRHKDRTESFV